MGARAGLWLAVSIPPLSRVGGVGSDLFRLFMQNLSLTALTCGTFRFDDLGTRLFLLRCLVSRMCRSLDRLVDLVGMFRSVFGTLVRRTLICLALFGRRLFG